MSCVCCISCLCGSSLLYSDRDVTGIVQGCVWVLFMGAWDNNGDDSNSISDHENHGQKNPSKQRSHGVFMLGQARAWTRYAQSTLEASLPMSFNIY